MRLTILYGDDIAVSQQRATLLAGRAHDNVDLAGDGGEALLRAVRTPSLFGGTRVVTVENFDLIDVATARQLGGVGPSIDVDVVARSAKAPTAKTKKALQPLAHRLAITGLSVTKANRRQHAERRARELAAEYGVRLSPTTTSAVTRLYGDDIEAARGALWQLGVLGTSSPTPDDIERTAEARSGPEAWLVGDALADGDVARAVSLTFDASPPAVVASITRLLASAGRCAESAAVTPAAAAAVLGGPEWMARRPAAVARRLTATTVAASWQVLGRAAADSRVAADPATAVACAVAELGALWAADATR